MAHAGSLADTTRAAAYEEPCTRLGETMTEAVGARFPHGRHASDPHTPRASP